MGSNLSTCQLVYLSTCLLVYSSARLLTLEREEQGQRPNHNQSHDNLQRQAHLNIVDKRVATSLHNQGVRRR